MLGNAVIITEHSSFTSSFPLYFLGMLRTRLLAIFFTLQTLLSAQTADKMLTELINEKNFFDLERVYQANRTKTSFFIQQLCEGLISTHQGHYAEANRHFELLLKREHCDTDLLFSLSTLMAHNYEATSEYRNAYQIYSRTIATLRPDRDEERIQTLKALRKIVNRFKDTPPVQIDFSGSKRTIPLYKKNQLPFIPIKWGEKKGMALFDTGAQANIITRENAQAAKMHILQEPIEVTGLYGKQIFTDLAVAPEFEIGGIRLTNVRFLVIDQPLAFSSGQETILVESIIGLPTIQKIGVIEIDNKRNRLSILKPAKHPSGEKMLLINNRLWIQLFHNDEALDFIVDTGLSHTSLQNDFFTIHRPEIVQTGKKQTIGSITVDGFSEQIGRIIPVLSLKTSTETIRLADLPLENEAIKIGRQAGRVGNDFFSRFHKITFDFTQMRLQLKK